MPQPLVTAAPQDPWPSQVAAAVCIALLAPLAQLALRQTISAAGYVHDVALAAVHCPPQLVPPPAQGPRAPCGSPATTGLQVPSAALVSQAMHCSVQGALQQTPSTQNPDWHCPASWHARPLPIRPQEPSTHAFAPTQSPFPLHLSAQRLPSPLQAKGAHEMPPPAAAQVP